MSMSMTQSWRDGLRRNVWTSPRHHWEMTRQDCAYAFRRLRKSAGFSVLAVLTLGLGVGANTAIFSVVNAVLLRPLPYPRGNELVVVRQAAEGPGLDNINFSVKEVQDYRSQTQTLADVEEYHTMTFTLLGREEPLRVQSGVVSPGFFGMFGVRPIMGRDFRADDDRPGAPAVLLVSYEFWKQGLRGDPDIVGKRFQMNDKVHTVIGVLPPVPQYPNQNDVYMPTSACPFRGAAHMIEDRDMRMMSVFGRAKENVSAKQVNADLATIAARLRQDYPESYPQKMGYRAASFSLQNELTKQARPTLLVLLGAAGFVLLIACANIANLTLSQTARREREFAVRAALGAGKGRLLRQLLTESAMLAVAGALVGLFFASAGMDLLTAFAARFTPRAREIDIDRTVLLFTVVVAMVTSVVAGTLSAFFSRSNLSGALKDGGAAGNGRAKNRLRNLLIVSQVAFSFLLLAGAGLMLRSFIKLQGVNPGFVPQRVLTMGINLNFSKYTTRQQSEEVAQKILVQLQGQPGVMSAAISSSFPLDPDNIINGSSANPFEIEGQPPAADEVTPESDFRTATPDYFRTLGIPVLGGRIFTDADRAQGPQVAIINQALARHRWPGQDPVGHRVSFDKRKTWVTIVGVVGDTKEFGLDQKVSNQIYLPVAQFGAVGSVIVRAMGDPLTLARQAREAIYSVDSQIAITNMLTLEQARSNTLASPRLTANLLGIFAGLALIMAATGIGGIMALTVSQRMREIGIRMALGASPGTVLGMILKQGIALGVAGIAIGLVAAIALTRLLQTLLFEISPTDVATFAGVAVILLTAAVVSCWLPARRAAKIDPLTALHCE
jgi:putative ABC transport system permease protein